MIRRLVLRRGEPRSPKRRAVDWVLGVFLSGVVLFVVADAWLGLRETANHASAYRQPSADTAEDQRTRDAIRFRIGLLLRPRDGKAVIGGDPSARRIEAGLLYGRLAVLDERAGDTRGAASHMAEAVSLLRSAGHPKPTEEHIRSVIAQQDANMQRR